MRIKAVLQKDRQILIDTPYITLDSALKLANITGSGGQAKMIIQDGLVLVNGEICTMRGKKLVVGDHFSFENRTYEVRSK